MPSLSKRWAFAGAPLAAVLATSVALAAVQQTYSQRFTVKHPGKSSGMTFSATARDSAGGTPTAAKTVTLMFPTGTKIDTGVVPRCVKPTACPAKTKIGSGQATAVFSTLANKLAVTAYNRAGGMVLSITNPLGAPVILKPTIVGRKLTLTIPSLSFNGTPIIVSALSLNISKLGTTKKPYVKTPTSCPKSGAWKFSARFVYVDGTTTTLSSASSCLAH